MTPSHSPCASCKSLRRRCAKDCIFAPYFPSNNPHKFAVVHKVFGASNVSKMLQMLGVHKRGDAVSSLVFEANARIRDPVYGCAGAISYLQKEVSQLQIQLAMAQAEISCIQIQQEPVTPTPPAPPVSVDISDLVPTAYTSTMLTDDVISTVSSDDASYPCLHNITNHHNNDQLFNFISNNVIQCDNLKRESSSLWT